MSIVLLFILGSLTVAQPLWAEESEDGGPVKILLERLASPLDAAAALKQRLLHRLTHTDAKLEAMLTTVPGLDETTRTTLIESLDNPFARSCGHVVTYHRDRLGEDFLPAIKACTGFQTVEELLCLDGERKAGTLEAAAVQACTEAPSYAEKYLRHSDLFREAFPENGAMKNDILDHEQNLERASFARKLPGIGVALPFGLAGLLGGLVLVASVSNGADLGAALHSLKGIENLFILALPLGYLVFTMAGQKEAKEDGRKAELALEEVFAAFDRYFAEKYPDLVTQTGKVKSIAMARVPFTQVVYLEELRFEKTATVLRSQYLDGKGLVLSVCHRRKGVAGVLGYQCGQDDLLER
ncbi:MAG: hypothetical protein A2284_11055 [Deltaproteobacteria bacterium RIFOXYA12_FULL_61_11]|nr:MAG: hypothetical protein A2284_11055 [Deltaproteobacteria bacterium RIFOXYA12_FULL_61_11]